MFEDVLPPLNEKSLFSTKNLYARARVCAYNMARNNGDRYGISGISRIMFNYWDP